MTPLGIQMALHYYTTFSEFPGLEHQAQQELLQHFLDIGFLVDNGDDQSPRYESTTKLDVYCSALCAVPEPSTLYQVKLDEVILSEEEVP